MMQRLGWISALILCGVWPNSPAIAAEEATPQACLNVAKRAPDGTSTDRFLREWCQRNHGKTPDSPTMPVPDAAGAAQPTDSPKAMESAPASEPSSYTGNGNDGLPESLNSSRLPPGYHCHMLKFGERICHGGLD